MSITEICLSLILALISVVGGLCAYIFNKSINDIKDDMNIATKGIREAVDNGLDENKNNINTLWTKYDDLKETVTAHKLSDETRFGRIDTLLGVKDEQFLSIIKKIDELALLVRGAALGGQKT